MIEIPQVLKPLFETLKTNGVSAVIVGGFVRDSLLNNPAKDIDIELYNVKDFANMAEILKPFGKANLVGKSFGVLKLSYQGYEIDFSLPRLEKKTASGHKGFEVILDPKLTFAQAAKRRDFTINAMGYDYNTQILLDPYDGQKDLLNKRLHFVDALTFIEDPLRVFRAIQFCARFVLTCSNELIYLCRDISNKGEIKELAKERIFEEFSKLLLKSDKPSIGLKLFELFSLETYFTPLNSNIFNEIDTMSKLKSGNSKKDLVLMFALLVFHMPSPNEVQTFLEKFTDEKYLVDSVLNLYMYRYALEDLKQKEITNFALFSLSTKTTIKDLLLLNKARGLDFSQIEELAERLNILTCKPKPLLQGRDLKELGLNPSEVFSKILEIAYEAQLKEVFHTLKEAKVWLRNNIDTILKDI